MIYLLDLKKICLVQLEVSKKLKIINRSKGDAQNAFKGFVNENK